MTGEKVPKERISGLVAVVVTRDIMQAAIKEIC